MGAWDDLSGNDLSGAVAAPVAPTPAPSGMEPPAAPAPVTAWDSLAAMGSHVAAPTVTDLSGIYDPQPSYATMQGPDLPDDPGEVGMDRQPVAAAPGQVEYPSQRYARAYTQAQNPPPAPPDPQSVAMEGAARAREAEIRRSVYDWFDRHQDVAQRLAQGERGATEELNRRVGQDPFPIDAVNQLDPRERRVLLNNLEQNFAQPAIAQAGRAAPSSGLAEDAGRLGANLAARGGRMLSGINELIAQGKKDVAGVYRQVTGGDTSLDQWGNQAAADARRLSDITQRDQQNIGEMLPQGAVGEFLGGQVDLLMKMGAGAAATAITRNPKVGSAMFAGLFSADAAANAVNAARQRGASDEEMVGDAIFSGLKAAFIARLPMEWPSLARESLGTQMAGAYLSGTAITTGDAAADEAWQAMARGKQVDGETVTRLGMAMLQGGLPAAGLHAMHGPGELGTRAAGARDMVTAEPGLTRPDTMRTPVDRPFSPPVERALGGPIDLITPDNQPGRTGNFAGPQRLTGLTNNGVVGTFTDPNDAHAFAQAKGPGYAVEQLGAAEFAVIPRSNLIAGDRMGVSGDPNGPPNTGDLSHGQTPVTASPSAQQPQGHRDAGVAPGGSDAAAGVRGDARGAAPAAGAGGFTRDRAGNLISPSGENLGSVGHPAPRNPLIGPADPAAGGADGGMGPDGAPLGPAADRSLGEGSPGLAEPQRPGSAAGQAEGGEPGQLDHQPGELGAHQGKDAAAENEPAGGAGGAGGVRAADLPAGQRGQDRRSAEAGTGSPAGGVPEPDAGAGVGQDAIEAASTIGREFHDSLMGKGPRKRANAKLREAGLDPSDPKVREAFDAGRVAEQQDRVRRSRAQAEEDLRHPDYQDDPEAWQELTPQQRRRTIEEDEDARATAAEESRPGSLSVHQRFDEGTETPYDRRHLIQDAFRAAGYQPDSSSAASDYYEIGGAKIRVSDHDPRPTYEAMHGEADVDINTGAARRLMATRDSNGLTPEQIAALVRDVISAHEKAPSTEGDSRTLRGAEPTSLEGEASKASLSNQPARETLPEAGAGTQAKSEKLGPPRGTLSRADLERRLVAAHKASPDYRALDEQRGQDESIENSTYGAHTWLRDPKTETGFPPEIDQWLREDPDGKRVAKLKLLTLTDKASEAGGADVYGNIDDPDAAQNYFDRLTRRADLIEASKQGYTGNKALDMSPEAVARRNSVLGRGEVRAAKESARRNAPIDPATAFLAAVHDALEALRVDGQTAKPYSAMRAEDLPPGTRFEFQGEPFRVVEEVAGLGDERHMIRVLKDGGDYPEVPLDFLDHVPVDKGTLSHHERGGESHESGDAGQEGHAPAQVLSDEPPQGSLGQSDIKVSNRPSEPPAAAPTSDTGLMGQTIFRPATGNRQGGLFHEPVKVERATGDTATEAKIRDKFSEGEAATGDLYARTPSTVSDYGQGLVVVRGEENHPMSIFGKEGLNGRWSDKADGYLFSKLREPEVRKVVEELNQQRAAEEAGAGGDVGDEPPIPPTPEDDIPFSPTDKPMTALDQGAAEDSFDAKLKPPTASRIDPDPIKGGLRKLLSEIVLDFDKAIGKRLWMRSKGSPKSGGTYYPGQSAATVRYAGDLDTAAHEIAHYLDDRFNLVGSWAGPRQRSPFDAELIPNFSGYGSVRGSGARSTQRYQRAEGVAEWIRAWAVNPAAAEKAAPLFFKHFEQTVPAPARKALRGFGDDIRRYSGLSAVDKLNSNVQSAFDPAPSFFAKLKNWWTGKGDRPPQLGLSGMSDHVVTAFFDDLHPLMKAIGYAREMKGLTEMSPMNDPELRIRLYAGESGKFKDILENGPLRWESGNLNVPFERGPGIKGGAEWLLGADLMKGKTMEEARRLHDDAAAYLNAGRFQEKADLLRREAADAIAALDPNDPKLVQKSASLKDAAEARIMRMAGWGAGVHGDEAVANAAMKELTADPARHALVADLANRYRAWANANLTYMLEGGRLSKESYDRIKASNQFYSDWHRAIEEILPAGAPGGRKLGSVSEPIQRWKGSSRELQSPFVNLLAQTYGVLRETDRNAAMNSFADLLRDNRTAETGYAGRLTGPGQLPDNRAMYQGKPLEMDYVGRKGKEGDDNTIKIYNKGKAEYWQFSDDVYKAMKGWGESDNPGIVAKVMRTLLKKIPQGLITRSPDFLIRQLLFKDPFARAVMSESGSKPWDSFRKFSEDVRSQLDAAGGSMGIYEASQESYGKAIRDAISEVAKDKKTVLGIVGAPVRRLAAGYEHYAQDFGETRSRLAEYKSAYDKARASGATAQEAAMTAAGASRELVDYAKAGRFIRSISKYVPFFNASFQAPKAAWDGLKRDPRGMLTRWAAYVLIPRLAMYAWNNGDDERSKAYQQLPAWRRHLMLNFRVGDTWESIPSPYEMGVLGAGLEESHAGMMDKSGRAGDRMKHWMYDLLNSVTPSGPASMLAGPLRGVVENSVNRDMFFWRPIVPTFEEDKDMSLRDPRSASRLGKVLQAVTDKIGLGVDARKIDHFIYTTAGGVGKLVMNASDLGREDRPLGGMLMQASGLMTQEPAWSSTDVQWLMDKSKSLGLQGARPMRTLSEMLAEHSDAKTISEKAEVARDIQGYASTLRDDYELPDVDAAIRAAAKLKDYGGPMIRDLQEMIEYHASSPTLQRGRMDKAVKEAAAAVRKYYDSQGSDIAAQKAAEAEFKKFERRQKVQAIGK